MLLLFFRKEFLILQRKLDRMLAGLFVSVLMCLLLCFGVAGASLTPPEVKRIAPCVLWVCVFVSATIHLERSYDADVQSGVLDAVLLTKAPMVCFYLAKIVIMLLQVALIVAVVGAIVEGVLGVGIGRHIISLAGVFVPSVVGFVALSTLLGAATSTSQVRGLLYPVVLFPLLFPLFLVSVELTSGVLVPGLAVDPVWWWVLWALGGMYGIVGGTLFQYVIKP